MQQPLQPAQQFNQGLSFSHQHSNLGHQNLDELSNDLQDPPPPQQREQPQIQIPVQQQISGNLLAQQQNIPYEEILLSQACEAEKEVAQEDDSLVAPEVSEQMMLMVKNFLGRTRRAAKIDDLVAEFLWPRNMPFLKSPKIEEIFLRLGPPRKFDKNCRDLQGYLNASMTALMRCIHSLLKLEKLHSLITESGLQAKKALQLMAFTNKEINDRRKDALRLAVNPECLPLLNHAKPPSDDWLLGGTLNDSIKECDESKKLAEKLMKNRKTGQQPVEVVQNVPQQNNFRQRYRNRGNKREYRNHNQPNPDNRNQWNTGGFPVEHVQPQQQTSQIHNVNWNQQQQQLLTFWPQQYWQQHLPQQQQQQQQHYVPQQQQQTQSKILCR